MPKGNPIRSDELRGEIEKSAGKLLEMLVMVHPEIFRRAKATVTFNRTSRSALTGFEMKITGESSLPPTAPDVSTVRWTEDGIIIDKIRKAVTPEMEQTLKKAVFGDAYDGAKTPEELRAAYEATLAGFHPRQAKTIQAE